MGIGTPSTGLSSHPREESKELAKPLQDSSVVKPDEKIFDFDPTLLPSLVDVVFCCDATASMGPYIQGAKRTVKKIMQETLDNFKGVEVKFGFIAYRDHCDKNLLDVKDLCGADEMLKFVDGVQAQGGGDIPEAVHDGLWASIANMTWRENDEKNRVRMIFHITDAPPHGKEYTSDKGDSHPGGCPCKITLDQIADKLNDVGIEYVLMKIGNDCTKMEELFRSKFSSVQEAKAIIEAAKGEAVYAKSHFSKGYTAFESKALASDKAVESETVNMYKGKVAKYSKKM